jgi:hypothetical protein
VFRAIQDPFVDRPRRDDTPEDEWILARELLRGVTRREDRDRAALIGEGTDEEQTTLCVKRLLTSAVSLEQSSHLGHPVLGGLVPHENHRFSFSRWRVKTMPTVC